MRNVLQRPRTRIGLGIGAVVVVGMIAAAVYLFGAANPSSGLPATVAVGQQVAFKITDNLTIHSVTRTVTFDAQVTPQSETVLQGQAQTTVKYADSGITIPSVPSVMGVADM